VRVGVEITESVNVAVVDPAEFVAVTAYCVDASTAVGVPEITQLELMLKVLGSVGEIVHPVIGPPLPKSCVGVIPANAPETTAIGVAE
jgi:hypothetical protein